MVTNSSTNSRSSKKEGRLFPSNTLIQKFAHETIGWQRLIFAMPWRMQQRYETLATRLVIPVASLCKDFFTPNIAGSTQENREFVPLHHNTPFLAIEHNALYTLRQRLSFLTESRYYDSRCLDLAIARISQELQSEHNNKIFLPDLQYSKPLLDSNGDALIAYEFLYALVMCLDNDQAINAIQNTILSQQPDLLPSDLSSEALRHTYVWQMVLFTCSVVTHELFTYARHDLKLQFLLGFFYSELGIANEAKRFLSTACRRYKQLALQQPQQFKIYLQNYAQEPYANLCGQALLNEQFANMFKGPCKLIVDGFNDYTTLQHFSKYIQSNAAQTQAIAPLLERYTLLDLWPQAAWQAPALQELSPDLFFGQAQVHAQAYDRVNNDSYGSNGGSARSRRKTKADRADEASFDLDLELDDKDVNLLQDLKNKRYELKHQYAAQLEQIKSKPQQYVNSSCTFGSSNNALLDSFVKNDLVEMQVFSQQDIVDFMQSEYANLYERAMFKLYAGKESSLWRYELSENCLSLPLTPLQHSSKYYQQLLQYLKRQQSAEAEGVDPSMEATGAGAGASTDAGAAGADSAGGGAATKGKARPHLSDLGPAIALAPAQTNANTAVTKALKATLNKQKRSDGCDGTVSGPVAPELRLTAELLAPDGEWSESLQALAAKAQADADRTRPRDEHDLELEAHQQAFYSLPDSWQQLVDLHGGAKLSYAQRIHEELLGIGQWRYVFGGHFAPAGRRSYIPWHIMYPALFYRALLTQMGDAQFGEDSLFRLLLCNQSDEVLENKLSMLQNKFSGGLSIISPLAAWSYEYIFRSANHVVPSTYNNFEHKLQLKVGRVLTFLMRLYQERCHATPEDEQILQMLNNILGLDVNDLCRLNSEDDEDSHGKYYNRDSDEDDEDDDDDEDIWDWDDDDDEDEDEDEDEDDWDDDDEDDELEDDDDDDFWDWGDDDEDEDDELEDDEDDDDDDDDENESASASKSSKAPSFSFVSYKDKHAQEAKSEQKASVSSASSYKRGGVTYDDSEEEYVKTAMVDDDDALIKKFFEIDDDDTLDLTEDALSLLKAEQVHKELNAHDVYDAQWRVVMLFLRELSYISALSYDPDLKVLPPDYKPNADSEQLQNFLRWLLKFIAQSFADFPSLSYLRPAKKNGFDFTQYIAGGAKRTIYTNLLQVKTNPEYNKFYANFQRLSELNVGQNLRVLLVPDEHPDEGPYSLLNVPEHNLLVQNCYNYTTDTVLHPQALCLQLLHVQNTDSTANKLSEFIRFLAQLKKSPSRNESELLSMNFICETDLSLFHYYEQMPRMKVYVDIGNLDEGLFDDITECTFVPRNPQDQASTKFLRAVPWLREIWRYVCSLLGINVARWVVSHLYLVNTKAFDDLYHQYQDQRVVIENDLLEDTESFTSIRFKSVEKMLEMDRKLQAAAAKASAKKAATMPRHCALAFLGIPLEQVTFKYSLALQPMTGLFAAFNRQFTYAVNPQAFGFAPQVLPEIISRWRLDVFYGRSTCLPLVQEYYDGILQQHLHLQLAQGSTAASFYRQNLNQVIHEEDLNTTTQAQGLSRIRSLFSQQVQEQGLDSNVELSNQQCASSSPKDMAESENQISMKYLSNIGAHAGFVILPLPEVLKTNYNPEIWDGEANAGDISKGLEVEKLFSEEQMRYLEQLDQSLRQHFERNQEFNTAPQAVDYTGFAVGTSALYLDFLIWDLNQFPSVINDLKHLPLCKQLDLQEMYFHSFDVADELRLL